MSNNPNFERIWEVVARLPAGSVASYGQVAELAGLPRRARLVSAALKAAPAEANLPWHRVVAAQGRIALPKDSTEYLEQITRLQTEGLSIRNGKVCLPSIEDQLWSLSIPEDD